MRPNRLQNALAALGDAMREVNAAIDEKRRQHDPLASHIVVSRRLYQAKSETKSCKRHHRGRGSVGSRRAILRFAATSASGSDF
jgi:hypothetical protein